jgi:prolyl-tRNA editing enzyme YbaK/EbsC (Cys-tRNA(Pro) deacylase)
MSKSLRRVERALAEAGLPGPVAEMDGDCTTAEAAAATLGVEVDRIAKSVLLAGTGTGAMFLFLTAGTNAVEPERAAALAGEPLERPGAQRIRAETGFAIGGVAPLGHLCPVTAFIDPRLFDFPTVWAAAGTPRHVFEAAPEALARATGASRRPFTA